MSVSSSRRATGARSVSREAITPGKMIRTGLLCSTALIAASLAASGAMAQTYNPTGGGAIVITGGGTTTDNTGTGGGFGNVSGGGIAITDVNITNTTGAPTTSAINFTRSTFSGTGDGGQFVGTNTLVAAPGGSAFNFVSTGGNNTGIGFNGTLNATGLNGIAVSTNGALFHSGAATFNLTAQTAGQGSGLLWTAASCICDTSLTGAFNATNFQYGANLTAPGGINFTTGTGGTIAGVATGVSANTSDGAITLAVGSSISASSRGISAISSGVGSVSVTSNAEIVSGGNAIYSSTGATSGNVINLNADATGAGLAAVHTVGQGYTINVGADATVTGSGTNSRTLFMQSGDGVVVNTGTIRNLSGDANSAIQFGQAGTVTNTGTISYVGNQLGAIFANTGLSVTNSGTISSTGAQQVAIYSNGAGTFATSVTNQTGGSIVGLIGLFNSGTGINTLDLQAGSSTGGVRSWAGGATTANVAGTLAGAYDAAGGAGATTLTLASTGSITGAVTFGSGNDVFNWQGGTFTTINAGSGTADTFNSALGVGVSGTLNQADLSGFESYRHLSGTLVVNGSRSVGDAWQVNSGASIDLAGSITSLAGTGQAIIVNGNTAGSSVNIRSGATINAFNGVWFNGGGVYTFANAGTMTASGGYAVLANGPTSFTNTGSISAAQQYAVFFGNGLSTVTNSGVIVGGADAIAGVGIRGGTGGLTVNNSAIGTIAGGTGAIVSANGLTLTNAGLVGVGTVDGAGVYTFGGTGYAIDLANGGTINNSGTIRGGAAIFSNGTLNLVNTGAIRGGQGGFAAGIYQDAIWAAGATILNAGSITVTDRAGTVGEPTYAAINLSNGDSTVTNAAGGVLEGGTHATLGNAIQTTTTGVVTFNNYGSATGGASVGSGFRQFANEASILNLHAGSVTGSILTGAGNDILSIYSGRGTDGAATVDGASGITLQNAGTLGAAVFGTADLGGGTNTLRLRGTGDGTAANGVSGTFDLSGGSVIGASILNKLDAGTWTLTGNGAGVTTINAGSGGNDGLLILNGTGLTAGITINGATVRAMNAAALGTGLITMINPTLQFASTDTYTNAISLAASDPINDPTNLQTFGTGITATLSGAITQATAGQPLVFSSVDANGVANAGTFVLTNTGNSWTGQTQIESGVTLRGQTTTISGGSVLNNGALVFSQGSAGNFASAISGTGSLRMTSGGAVTLLGTNTFTGGTTVDGFSNLLIGNGGTTGSITGPISLVNGNVWFNRNDGYVNSSNITGNSGSQVFLGGLVTLNGSITGSQVVVQGTGITLGGVVSGANASAVALNSGNLSVANTGSIQGGQFIAVRLASPGSTLNNLGSITNSGTGGDGQIGAAVYVSTATGTTTINNGSLTDTGAGSLIQGRNAGVRHQGGSDTLVVKNYGHIIGDLYNGIENSAGGLTVNNFAGGLIRGAFTGISGAGVMNITNAGTISGVNGSSNGIVSSGTLTLVNQNGGQITGGATGSGVLSTGANAAITNAGSISGAVGLNLSGAGGTITNQSGGSITGSGTGIASSNVLTLTNSGTIRQTNGGGAAVSLVNGGTVLNNADGLIAGFDLGLRLVSGDTTVTNAGSITGGANDAIYAGGALTLSNAGVISSDTYSGVRIAGGGSVTNSGSITGGSFAGQGYGVQVNTAATTLITNQSGGLITGGVGSILLSGAGDTTINLQAGSTTSGDINASAATGAIQTLLMGAFNGAYIGGAGVDNLNLYSTASGTFSLDGGAGTSDAVNFVSAGDSTRSGPITNFEIARFNGTGTVTLTGTNTGLQEFFINSGTVSVSSAANMGDATGMVSLYGGALQTTASFDSNRTYRTTNLFGLAGRIDVGAGTTFGIAGGLSGDGDLIVGGAGTLNLLTTNSGFSGDIFVNGSALRAGAAGAFGTGTIHMINPTLIYGATGFYANNILLEVQSPATADPSTLRAEAGVAAFITGSITQGAGMGVDPFQPLVIDGPGAIILTNTANSWAGTTTVTAGSRLQGTTQTVSGNNLLVNGDLTYLQSTSGTLTANASGTGRIFVQGLGAGQVFTVASALDMTNFGLLVSDNSELLVTGSIRSSNGTALNLNNPSTVASVVTNSGTISGVSGISGVGPADVTNLSGGVISSTTGNTVRFGLQDASLVNAGSVSGASNFAGVFFGGIGSVTNQAGGAITNTATAVQFGGASGTLDNSGTISNGNTNSAVYFNGTGSVINRASGTVSSANGYGVQFVGAGAAVTNLGVISAGQRGVSLDGANSTLTNSGQISGGGHAFVSLNGTSTVTNQVGGVMTGTNFNAVFIRGAGSMITNAGLMNGGNAAVYTEGANTSLTNTGTIRVTGTTSPTVISGVYMAGVGSSVTNSGTIESTLTNGRGVYLSGGTGTIINQSDGVISGNGTGAAILLAGADYTVDLRSSSTVNGLIDASLSVGLNLVNIAGAANGGYVGGTGADDITVASSGSVTGAVDLGAGDDSFTLNSGGSVSGLIDGGAGTDAFILAGVGDASFNVAQAVNFETRAMNGTGTWTLTGTDTSTAGWALNAGVLALSGGSAINDAAGVTIAGGATLALLNDEAIGSLAGSGFVNLGAGRLTLAGAQTTAYAGLISGSGGLTIGAAHGLTLSGANTYTGTTVVDGVLTLGAAGVLADGSNLLVSTTGVVDLQGFDETVNNAFISGVLNGTGALTAGQYQLTGATVNANLGAGDLFNTGGVSTLNGTSGSQLVSIASGTLGLGASDRLSDTATVVVANGAVLDLNAFNDTVGLLGLAGTLNGTGTLTAGQYQLTGATVNANLGAGDLIQVSGVSTLNGTAGSQLVSIAGGTLGLGASDRLSDTATVVVANGAVLDLNAFNDTVGLLGLAGTLNGAGTLTAGQYQLDGATVNANLGAGDLFNTGGVSTLNGTSGAGLVSVQAGTLTLGASDRLSDAATVVVANGATLDLGAFNDTVNLALLNGTLAGAGTLTADQYQLTGATVNANLGAGTLFNLGGVSTLNGTAAAADVLLNAGTLRLGASGRLADAATVSVASGATFDLNGFDQRIGALFGTGDVTVGAGRLTFGGGDSGFGGRLSGAGSLVHTGGLFTLMGDHTIASIRNTGGELRFLGATTGAIAVTGGSLTGAGTIGGALTASNGAILSPGVAGFQNGVGGFVAGGLTLNGATLAIDVLGRSGGFLIDQLRINGTATLTGGLIAPTFQGGAADFDFSTRYLFLQANTLVGTFANGAGFTAAEQEGLFWRVRYDLSPNAAVLELRELTDFDPGATGTGNQRAVGQALSGGQLEASDDFAGILGLFASLNDADRAAALNSISGEPLADMTTSLFGANGSFLTAVRDGGLSGRESGNGALGFVGGRSFAGGRESIADRVGAAINAFDPSASTTRGAGGWVAVYRADQTLEGKPGTANVSSRLNGFAGGYGVRNGAMSLGAAAGLTQMEGDVVARQAHYESELAHAAAYAAFDDGVWAADVTVSIYGGGLDSRRGIRVGAFEGQAIGDTHAEGQAISASVSRRFQLSQDTMIALGAIGTASSASIDGFTETGAGGLSLEASGLERDWQSLQISARGTQDYHVDGRRFRIYGGAGVMATTGDRQATGDMRFSGAPTGFGAFTVEGAETPPVAGLVDFGLEVGVGGGLTLSAGYRGLYSERLRDNQAGVRLRANW